MTMAIKIEKASKYNNMIFRAFQRTRMIPQDKPLVFPWSPEPEVQPC